MAKEQTAVGHKGPFHFKNSGVAGRGLEYGHPYDEVLQSVHCLPDSILNPALCITVYFFLQSTIPFPPSDLANILAKPKDLPHFGLLLWQNDKIFQLTYFLYLKCTGLLFFSSMTTCSAPWISRIKESLARTSLV